MLRKLRAWSIALPAGFLVSAIGPGLACAQVVTEGGDVVVLQACGANELQDTACSFDIVTNKEIFIIDSCVVDDPCRTRWDGINCTAARRGAWTFGKLAASMAGFPSVDTNPQAL